MDISEAYNLLMAAVTGYGDLTEEQMGQIIALFPPDEQALSLAWMKASGERGFRHKTRQDTLNAMGITSEEFMAYTHVHYEPPLLLDPYEFTDLLLKTMRIGYYLRLNEEEKSNAKPS